MAAARTSPVDPAPAYFRSLPIHSRFPKLADSVPALRRIHLTAGSRPTSPSRYRLQRSSNSLSTIPLPLGWPPAADPVGSLESRSVHQVPRIPPLRLSTLPLS